MPPPRPLSSAFARGAACAEADLEPKLESLIVRGVSAWPEVELNHEHFAEYLGARVSVSDLESVRIEDLWIACACGASHPKALEIIETRYMPSVDAALSKTGVSQDHIADAKQGLRHLLFVGDGRTPPRIRDYRGSGDLRAWLRVSALRAALKLIRKDGRATSSDETLLGAIDPQDDPELAFMKASYRAAFSEAFQEALGSLQPKERTLLKQHHVDGLSVDELAGLYGTHRATTARWVAAAREKLLLRTRRTFMMQARISSEECDSIMRMIRSQLDLSLSRRLSSW